MLLCSVPRRCKEASAAPAARVRLDPLDVLVDISAHDVADLRSQLRCSRCLSCVARSASFCRQWLRSPCHSVPVQQHQPNAMPQTVVGRQVSHSFHSLAWFRGLVFCVRCGNQGPSRFVKLSQPCSREVIGLGPATFRAIGEGRLPPGLDAWPA